MAAFFIFLAALLAPAFLTFKALTSPAFKAGFLLALIRFGLAIVLIQEVQSLAFKPSIILVCRLIFCLFRVLILE